MKVCITPTLKVEWFYHSLFTSKSSDYVTFETCFKSDTLEADNILDVRVQNDTVYLLCCGKPELDTEPIKSLPTNEGYIIQVDTTGKCPATESRKEFMIEGTYRFFPECRDGIGKSRRM